MPKRPTRRRASPVEREKKGQKAWRSGKEINQESRSGEAQNQDRENDECIEVGQLHMSET